MPEPAYLFVYGTLLRGENNAMAEFLSTYSDFVGEGFFNGNLYLVSWFPGAILSDHDSEKVFGHIFKLKNETKVLSVLDDYEGIGVDYEKPHVFKREVITINTEEGAQLKSWVYLYNLSVAQLQHIPNGNYLTFKNQK